MRIRVPGERVRAAILAVAITWAATPVDAAPVRVRVRDAATGAAVAARAYLWRGDESLLPTGFPFYDKGAERHFLVNGDFVLELDPGAYRLRLERGHEFLPVELSVIVPGGVDTLDARLVRWIDMARTGWYSADMHVHRDPADLPLMLQAEDLTFAPTITSHVWSGEVSQPWKPRPEFVSAAGPGRFFTSNGQEIERIQGGPGAVILLGRDVPLPFAGDELAPPSSRFTRAVKERAGFVEGDKPFWVDVFVNALLGQIDAIEINCNHFMPRSVDTDLTPWSHWPIEFGYRGGRGFAEWMMASYYRLLNAGVELPLSAGTANGVKPGPVGFERVYVRGEGGGIEYDGFIDALRAGRSFSTNGPMIEFDVDDQTAAGARLALEPDHTYRVHARAQWRSELERLQLIVNGAIVAEQVSRQPPAGKAGFSLTLEYPLRVTKNSWVAVRAFARMPERPAWEAAPVIFAHSSPAYIRRPGELVLERPGLEHLLVQANQLIARVASVDGFRRESDRDETLALYRSAREIIASRLARASAR
jgi:hypothetical protein